MLTHWGRVTHICRRQAIIWTNAGILLICPLEINFSEILIEIYIFSFMKMHLKLSSGICHLSRPQCVKYFRCSIILPILSIADVCPSFTRIIQGCFIGIKAIVFVSQSSISIQKFLRIWLNSVAIQLQQIATNQQLCAWVLRCTVGDAPRQPGLANVAFRCITPYNEIHMWTNPATKKQLCGMRCHVMTSSWVPQGENCFEWELYWSDIDSTILTDKSFDGRRHWRPTSSVLNSRLDSVEFTFRVWRTLFSYLRQLKYRRIPYMKLAGMGTINGIYALKTHWGRSKMADIFQTTFSNGYSWMKKCEFRLKFHWSLFLRVLLTIFHHWFR